MPLTCSRSRRPGSIAAAPPRSRLPTVLAPVPGHVDRAPLRRGRVCGFLARDGVCSRSRRPGSIAACLGRVFGDDPYGSVPGHVDRAPLRRHPAPHTAGRTQVLFPVTSTGLHCGRFATDEFAAYHADLFPVTSTGLHCGVDRRRSSPDASIAVPGHVDRAPLRRLGASRSRGDGMTCSRSRRPGSIAARRRPGPGRRRLRCSRSRRPGSIAASRATVAASANDGSVPGHVDRAPLRPGGQAHRVVAVDLLFPVTSTGLHCGPRAPPQRRGSSALFPVTSTGLHCGLGGLGPAPLDVLAVPGHVDRAPLRQKDDWELLADRATCSRSRRPGAVAARCAAPA